MEQWRQGNESKCIIVRDADAEIVTQKWGPMICILCVDVERGATPIYLHHVYWVEQLNTLRLICVQYFNMVRQSGKVSCVSLHSTEFYFNSSHNANKASLRTIYIVFQYQFVVSNT